MANHAAQFDLQLFFIVWWSGMVREDGNAYRIMTRSRAKYVTARAFLDFLSITTLQ